MTLTLHLGLSYSGLAITCLLTTIIMLFTYFCVGRGAIAESAFIYWLLFMVPAIANAILGVICTIIATWFPGGGYEWIPFVIYLLTLSWSLYWRLRC